MQKPIFFSVVLIFIFAACSGALQETDRIPLAKVGDRVLFVDEAIRNIPGYLIQNDSIKSLHQYRDNWVRDQILFDEALRLGLKNHEAVREQIEKSERDILIGSLRDQIVRNTAITSGISNSEVSSFYEVNRNQFVLQSRHVRVRHLFTETSEEAEEAKDKLVNGVSWPEIVQDYAVDQNYSLSTDRELLSVNDAFPGFPTMKSYLMIVGLMEVSPIFREDRYYHFIQIVEDRPPGDHPDLAMVFDQIKNWIQVDKSRKSIQAYEQNLYLQAQANDEIVIY